MLYKRRSWLFVSLSLLIVAGLLIGCAAPTPTPTPVPTPAPTPAPTAQPTAKYIFLFIGDGLGVAQRNAAELYLAATTKPGARPEEAKLLMNTFPSQGMNTTYDLTSVIPDSASTATALATGFKTSSGTINMDPKHTTKYQAITEVAKSKGWKVGVISSVSLDHATPAAFYGHQSSRKNMYELCMELATSNFDYFAGGQMLKPKKEGQPNAIETAKANGFTVVTNRADFEKLTPGVGKVIAMSAAVDEDGAMYYEVDRPYAQEYVTLSEYVRKGIELLNNPMGFFMVVEGGKIDWACHANDAAASIHDTLALDAAVAEAFKFYQQHPNETLIIVTGDHETGGMSIGFAGTQYSTFVDKIQYQKMSYIEFTEKLAEYKKSHTLENAKLEDLLPLIQDAFGLSVLSKEERAALAEKAKADKEAAKKLGMTLSDLEAGVVEQAFVETMKDAKIRSKDDYTYLMYGGYEPLAVKLTTILNQKAGISWTSYSHTGVPVQTSAIGVGHEKFNGYYDQTDIHKKMMAIAGFDK